MEPYPTTSPSADGLRLASLLEVFDHAFWEWHVQTGAMHFTPEWLRALGYEPAEVPPDVSFWSTYTHPDDYEPVRDLVQAHLEGHAPHISADARIRSKDGTWRTLSFRAKVVERTAAGEPVRVVGVSLDRTPAAGGGQAPAEQRQAEARLMRAERLENIGRVAGAVAHDFNNLLTVINGYAEIALGSLNARDPLHDSLQEIKSAGDRAASLTQQLLAFSRRQVMQAAIVNVNDLLEDLEAMLRRLLGDQVELVLERDAGIGAVRADPAQLRQVVMNLVMNARDAMPNGGKVVIATTNTEVGEDVARLHANLHPGEYVLVSVTDTGSGMDEATLGRLFEPFFTTKQKGKGTGLGLASAYGIVRQSGGHLAAQSELGRGTTFTIHLPRVAAEEKRTATAAAAGRRPKGTETILLVEDQPEVRQLATRALKMYGYRVLPAGNGAEALEVARRQEEPIALLLTDVLMPGMTGPALAAAMMDLRPGISVLLMSGYSDPAPMPGRLPQGIECLQKPFTPEALARKVRAVLDAHKAPGGGRVLVVDDEAEIRKLLRQFLEHAGYAVAEAANGLQAVAEVDAGGVSLVITDLVMPEKEGIETIREMRRRHRDVKIIAMSGAFGGRFLRTAEILGAHATLSKPVRAEQLVRTVGALLGAA